MNVATNNSNVNTTTASIKESTSVQASNPQKSSVNADNEKSFKNEFKQMNESQTQMQAQSERQTHSKTETQPQVERQTQLKTRAKGQPQAQSRNVKKESKIDNIEIPVVFQNNVTKNINDEINLQKTPKHFTNNEHSNLSSNPIMQQVNKNFVKSKNEKKDVIKSEDIASTAVDGILSVDINAIPNIMEKKQTLDENSIIQTGLIANATIENFLKGFNNPEYNNMIKYLEDNLEINTSNSIKKGALTGKAEKISSSSNYASVNMTSNDAEFFLNLVKSTEGATQMIDAQKQVSHISSMEEAQAVRVSKSLMNMLSEASKTNQPCRIDFDNNVSVVLKVGRDGQISAEFIPGDKVAEQYLKSMLPQLRQRFDDEQINYKDLSYKQHGRQQQGRKQKENEHG